MTIYCDKCGASHDSSVCPSCSGFGKSRPMTAPDDVRARFEAWAKSQRYYVDRAAHGFYKSCRTHDAWEGYRAAPAAPADGKDGSRG